MKIRKLTELLRDFLNSTVGVCLFPDDRTCHGFRLSASLLAQTLLLIHLCCTGPASRAMMWCNASRSGGEGDDLPLTQGAGTWEGGYSAVCEAETTLPSISERVSTLEMQPDRNPPTITRTASNLRTGNSFFSAASALPSWPWRPAPGRRERQSHLLYASVLLVVGAFLLGVGVCIGQSRAISSRSEGSVKFFPPSGLGQVKADWPTHSLLGNTWSPRDVEPLFTAYHFTDAHIEPLYGTKSHVVETWSIGLGVLG